jgi:3-oxoacyl-(acyl-carrier-protein) synthase
MMQLGRADVMLVGGCEAISDALIAAVDAEDAHLDCPGGVLGEGAAVLVLETETHALGRGAQPIAMLTGAAALAPCNDRAGEHALLAAGAERAQVIDAATVCGHTFGASVALSAACCAALAAEADEPLAAVSSDGSGAVVIERWSE